MLSSSGASAAPGPSSGAGGAGTNSYGNDNSNAFGAQPGKWEAGAMLNAYILDHMRKQNLAASVEAFSKEAVVGDQVLIDAPGGFLFEWWSVFWDILSARTKKPASDSARAYVEQQRQMAQWRRRSFDPSALADPALAPPPPHAGMGAQGMPAPMPGQPRAMAMPPQPPGFAQAPGAPPSQLQSRRPSNLRINVPPNGAPQPMGVVSQQTYPPQPQSQGQGQGQGQTQGQGQGGQGQWPSAPGMPQSPRYYLAPVSPHTAAPPAPFMTGGGYHGAQPPRTYGSGAPQPSAAGASPSGAPQNPFDPYAAQTQSGGPQRSKAPPPQAQQPPQPTQTPPQQQGQGQGPGQGQQQQQQQAQAKKRTRTPSQEQGGSASATSKRSKKEAASEEKGAAQTQSQQQSQGQGAELGDGFEAGGMYGVGVGDGFGGDMALSSLGMGFEGELDANAVFGAGSEAGEGEDVVALEPVRELAAHADKVLACSLNYEGSILATAGRESELYLWETATGKLKKMAGHADAVYDVRFCHQRNTLLATCSADMTARVWDLSVSQTTAVLRGLPPQSPFTSIDFHPAQHTLLATTHSDGVVRLWSYPLGDRSNTNASLAQGLGASAGGGSSAAEAQCLSQLGAGMRQARFSPRSEGVVLVAGYDAKLNVFDVSPSGLQYAHTLSKHDKAVQYVAWDRDGKLVLSVSDDSVHVWDPRQQQPARSLARPHLKFSCASFHPAHSNSVLVGGYQSVWHWDWGHDALAPGSALRSQWRAHEGVVSAMACSVRADQLATVSHDTRVKLWKVS